MQRIHQLEAVMVVVRGGRCDAISLSLKKTKNSRNDDQLMEAL